MKHASLTWVLSYIALVVILPGLFGWYVLPKLTDWNRVKWGGFPQGWVDK